MNTNIILALVATLGLVKADPGRGSTDYTLTHETTAGAAGTRSTSTDYTLDDAGDSAASVATSADYTHRDGFAGQLIDPALIDVSAPNSITSETNSMQFAADLVFDDGTVEFDITPIWSTASGPISIDANGFGTTEIVYQDMAYTVQADHLGVSGFFSGTVFDKGKDNFGTYATDGIPDLWQIDHFGFDNPDAAPGVDPDGDGQDNTLEYLAGYLPDDVSSFLSTSILTEDTIELSKIIPARTYTLSRSTDLLNWAATGATLTTATEQADQTITDPAPPAGERVFYKVDIED